ncbi:MAG: SRPBCC family protein [Persicimonas sp.]
MSESERGKKDTNNKQVAGQRQASTESGGQRSMTAGSTSESTSARSEGSRAARRELQVQRDHLSSYTRRPERNGLEQIDNPAMFLGGGALAYWGVKHWRSALGLLAAGIGGGLIYQGLKQNDLLDGNFKELLLNTGASKSTEVRSTITINRPVDEVWEKWRDLSNLGHCMKHIESVSKVDDTHWHWKAHVPKSDNMLIEWDSEIIDERDQELLVWRSVRHAEIQNEGMVEFKPSPDGDGTEIHAHIVYYPPAGKVGQTIGRFLKGTSEQLIKQDLRRFKQFMEIGEVPTVDGQTSGRTEPPQGRRMRSRGTSGRQSLR